MLNNCSFIGRLVRTPELRRTKTDAAVASFTLAVDRSRPTKDGEWLTDFLDFVSWRGLAEKVCKCQKGDLLAVTGRLEIHPRTDAEGKIHYNAEIVAESLRKISSPKGASAHSPAPSAPAAEESQFTELPDEPGDGELPF